MDALHMIIAGGVELYKKHCKKGVRFMTKHTIRDLLLMDVDIDVYDNVCESLAIAFCGPMNLTEEGKEHFKDVLDLPVIIYTDDNVAIVDVDDSEGVWQKKLKGAKELFYALAGFCSITDYDTWFIEP